MRRALQRGLLLVALTAVLIDTAGCARKRIYGETTGTIEAQAGQDFVIELASNPTTGFSWVMGGQPDPGIVVQTGTDYEPGNPGVIGAGGVQRLTFRANGRGTTTMRIDYRRPYEAMSPERSAAFTVIVR